MIDMNDLFLSMQRGAATEALARQFGLSEEQARLAMSALMPAFLYGLREPDAASDPFGAQAWLRRVAEQAGAMSGMNAQLLQTMMPAVAAMMAGAFARGPVPPAAGAGAWASVLPDGHPMAKLMAMMGAAMAAPEAPAKEPDPFEAAGRAGLDTMTRMFEAGRAMQESQVAAMQGLFDAFLPKSSRDPK